MAGSPTPRIDRISASFAQKLNDPNGDSFPPLTRMAYINRAMMELFNTVWTAVKGDISEFLKILPELQEIKEIPTTGTGTYVISTSALIRDIMVPISGILDDKYVKHLDPSLYAVVKTGKHSNYKPAEDNLICFMVGDNIEFLPAASFNSQTVTLVYIKLPLNPTDGSFLTQAGDYDSPFMDHWNDKIVNICLALFDADRQSE